MLLFCHAYMQSANIEYVRPTQPVRAAPGPETELSKLAAMFTRSAAKAK